MKVVLFRFGAIAFGQTPAQISGQIQATGPTVEKFAKKVESALNRD
jgi:hypothetical protein